MHSVFISYSTKDKKDAEALKQRLERSGLSCWYAPEDIVGAQIYPQELIDGIDECKIVALILSPASQGSKYVHAEIEYANSSAKPIVVVTLNGERVGGKLRPLLVGCDRVDSDSAILIKDVRRAITRARVAKRSKIAALLLSVVPGAGLLFVGMRRWGGVLMACGALTLLWSYFLELGTPLDRFLSCVFHTLIFMSIVATAHTVLGAVSGSMNRKRRWLPYVASILAPGSGIAYAGRRKCGWAFFWILSALFAVMMCSGMAFTIDGCCMDAALYQAVYLLAIAESGFEDVQGRHRSPWLYSIIVLFVVALVYFSIPRCVWNG